MADLQQRITNLQQDKSTLAAELSETGDNLQAVTGQLHQCQEKMNAPHPDNWEGRVNEGGRLNNRLAARPGNSPPVSNVPNYRWTGRYQQQRLEQPLNRQQQLNQQQWRNSQDHQPLNGQDHQPLNSQDHQPLNSQDHQPLNGQDHQPLNRQYLNNQNRFPSQHQPVDPQKPTEQLDQPIDQLLQYEQQNRPHQPIKRDQPSTAEPTEYRHGDGQQPLPNRQLGEVQHRDQDDELDHVDQLAAAHQQYGDEANKPPGDGNQEEDLMGDHQTNHDEDRDSEDKMAAADEDKQEEDQARDLANDGGRDEAAARDIANDGGRDEAAARDLANDGARDEAAARDLANDGGRDEQAVAAPLEQQKPNDNL